MAWIETHQSLATHRKTMTLADELGTSIPAAIGHLVMLWLWALDNAPDGNLGGVSPKSIARAAAFAKRPSDFLEALVASGFVDRPLDGPLSLHDWDSYGGRYTSQRERNRLKQQAYRDRLRDGDVTVTSPARVEKSRGEQSRQDDHPPYPPQAGGASSAAMRARQGSRRKRDVDAWQQEPKDYAASVERARARMGRTA